MKGAMVHHIAFFVDDLKQNSELFQSVFGMKITETEGEPDNPSQLWMIEGGIQLISRRGVEAPELAHIGVSVDNLEETLVDLYKVGGVSLPKGRHWVQMLDGLILELMARP